MGERVYPQFKYSAQIANTVDSTTVDTGPIILRGVWVNEAFSAHSAIIKDGTTSVFTLPAALAAGWYDLGDVIIEGSLVYDPDNAASAGNVTFVYKQS